MRPCLLCFLRWLRPFTSDIPGPPLPLAPPPNFPILSPSFLRSTYLYCRCSRSVSLASPAYYAHWAAYRGKALIANLGDEEASTLLRDLNKTWAENENEVRTGARRACVHSLTLLHTLSFSFSFSLFFSYPHLLSFFSTSGLDVFHLGQKPNPSNQATPAMHLFSHSTYYQVPVIIHRNQPGQSTEAGGGGALPPQQVSRLRFHFTCFFRVFSSACFLSKCRL